MSQRKQAGIVVLEYIQVKSGGSQGDAPVYKVSQLKNTVEWSIGQVLSKPEVVAIIKRPDPRSVEVIIKGLEFEG